MLPCALRIAHGERVRMRVERDSTPCRTRIAIVAALSRFRPCACDFTIVAVTTASLRRGRNRAGRWLASLRVARLFLVINFISFFLHCNPHSVGEVELRRDFGDEAENNIGKSLVTVPEHIIFDILLSSLCLRIIITVIVQRRQTGSVTVHPLVRK